MNEPIVIGTVIFLALFTVFEFFLLLFAKYKKGKKEKMEEIPYPAKYKQTSSFIFQSKTYHVVKYIASIAYCVGLVSALSIPIVESELYALTPLLVIYNIWNLWPIPLTIFVVASIIWIFSYYLISRKYIIRQITFSDHMGGYLIMTGLFIFLGFFMIRFAP